MAVQGRASRVIYCPGLFILFQNNIRLIEMISVYFNTTLEGYYQDELGSSDCFDFFRHRKEDRGSWGYPDMWSYSDHLCFNPQKSQG